MITAIDIFDNVGASRNIINENLQNLNGVVCDLHAHNNITRSIYELYQTHGDVWKNAINIVQALSGKWDTFSNSVFTLSGFWNTPISLIYPRPFSTGSINKNEITRYVSNNFKASAYNTDQIFRTNYLILNYNTTNPTGNVYTVGADSYCVVHNGVNYVSSDCMPSLCVRETNCNDLYDFIDLNHAYACDIKYTDVYYCTTGD